MFAYTNSPIARKSNDNTTRVNFCSRKPHNRSESYYNPCSIFNLVSELSDIEQKRLVQKKAEEAEHRTRLLQEQERRHKLCAEQERLVRERTTHQLSLKQEKSREALKKFYERKAKEAKFHCPYGNNSSRSSSPLNSINSSSSTTTTTTAISLSSFSSSCSRACPSSNNNSRQSSCRNLRLLVEKSKAALKINSFVIYHVRRNRTRRVLERLCELREIENRLMTERQDETMVNLLEQLNNIESGNSEIVCERKKAVAKAAKEILVSMAAEDDFVLVEVKE